MSEEWIDANGRTHRCKIRDKASGSFDMKFITEDDYKNFIQTLKTKRTGANQLKMTVYIVNEDQEKTSQFFYSFTGKVYKSRAQKTYSVITFNIEEY